MSGYEVLWFVLIMVLLCGYVVLDGFDLGVGAWALSARSEESRWRMMRSILPYWDGNEVWLITGAGAVFAAFPHVYATVFSGFYLALMLVLFSLIMRAVSLEFYHQFSWVWWRVIWGVLFGLSSMVAALLFGVAAGNLIQGIPLDAQYNYHAGLIGLINPFSVLVGVTTLAMIVMHGALFLAMKTDGETSHDARRNAQSAHAVFVVLLLTCFAVAITSQAHLLSNFLHLPVLWLLPLLAVIFAAGAGVQNAQGRPTQAFLMSVACIIAIFATLSAAVYPNLVYASNNPDLSLTIFNARSGVYTLRVMSVIAFLALPVIAIYSIWVHLIFRGKATDEHAY